MRGKIVFFLIFFLFLSFKSFASPSYPRSLQKILKNEPTFAEILEVYLKARGIQNHYLFDWEKKIKKAAWFPTLYLGYDQSFDASQSLSASDNISISDGTVTIGPEENDYDLDEDTGRTVRVRAVWRLSDVVFNTTNFALARERRDLARLHYDLSQKIYQLCEERYLYLLKYWQTRSVDSGKAHAFYGKYLLLTQKLDALTEGKFNKYWWEEGKK